jgi:Zn-dependent alcohol dehydrogenase
MGGVRADERFINDTVCLPRRIFNWDAIDLVRSLLMEYARKCQNCEHLKTILCHGFKKYQRTGQCLTTFRETRKNWVNALPVGGRTRYEV